MTPLRCLLSYAFFRSVDLAELVGELRAAYGGPVEVFADSGAFSVATTGATVRLKDYAAWLEEWSPVITTAATLDVIGDPDATARNTEALLGAGLRVLPTFHVGTPWSVLERLCRAYPYLALGGMVPHTKYPQEVMRWLIRAFRIAADHGAVFHGFGQTRAATLAALPFYSADSSTWITGAKYGGMALWDPRHTVVMRLQTGVPAEARRHARLLRDHGADPAVVGRPGFAHTSHRTAEEHRVEYDMMRATSMRAFQRLGQWLEQRHAVPAPPGWTTTGTCLFLAFVDRKQLVLAARTLGGELCSVS
ncbi:hypothetical protein ACH4F6_37625 [Streptomyces sp. NPDC017936]|uniref:hypothetical protein n=1 Tax=Streptomyces sp. NPDC017936 TaxID=3365016 RepID=UPI0037A83D6B